MDSQLRQLAEPFPPQLVKKPPRGKFGSYVSHSTVNERALGIVGPFSFGVVEVIRGHAEPVTVNKGKDNEHTYQSREAVVGCLASLEVEIDGQTVRVIEVGDVEGAAAQEDGANLKEASSDAFKRCWMRLGLGLHLWSQNDYFLPRVLDDPDAELDGVSPERLTNKLKAEALELLGDADEAKAIYKQALAVYELDPDDVVPLDLHEKVRGTLQEMAP